MFLEKTYSLILYLLKNTFISQSYREFQAIQEAVNIVVKILQKPEFFGYSQPTPLCIFVAHIHNNRTTGFLTNIFIFNFLLDSSTVLSNVMNTILIILISIKKPLIFYLLLHAISCIHIYL